MNDSVEAALRRDARKIFYAAVHAAEPAPLVHAALLNAPELHRAERIHVIAAGKAAPGMAVAAIETLGDRVGECIVVATRASIDSAGDALASTRVRTIAAGHPLPDADSVAAAHAVTSLTAGARDGDVIVVLLSGGASALLALPAAGISLEDYRASTSLLQAAGASIDELNCIRKHIDDIKGGGLARAAGKHTVVALVISDVVGNRVDVIASGPLSVDPTTFADALDVLANYQLTETVPRAVLSHLRAGARGDVPETEKPGSGNIERVRLQIITDNAQALDAAASFARRLGYGVARIADPVTGAARSAGRDLASQLRTNADASGDVCIIAGGETTVSVVGDGTGGRNQEVALAAALEIDHLPHRVLLSAGTDGIDGPTDAAGGIVDGGTCDRIRAAGLDPRALLDRNDSYHALQSAGDLLVTGATSTNVMDVHILLRQGFVER